MSESTFRNTERPFVSLNAYTSRQIIYHQQSSCPTREGSSTSADDRLTWEELTNAIQSVGISGDYLGHSPAPSTPQVFTQRDLRPAPKQTDRTFGKRLTLKFEIYSWVLILSPQGFYQSRIPAPLHLPRLRSPTYSPATECVKNLGLGSNTRGQSKF